MITRLVAHEGAWQERVELTLFPQRRRHRDVPLGDVATLLASARPDDGDPVTRPIVAVCTHGVRDRCCALFGGELAAALRRAEPADVEIREASHLGGDRFAPTVLVLPSGRTYGHLDAADAPALLDAARGRPALAAKFRGPLFLDPLAQLAEIAVYARAAEVDEVPTLGEIEATETATDRATLHCTFTLGARTEHLALEAVREHRLVVGDCRSADRGRRGSVHVWRTISLRFS